MSVRGIASRLYTRVAAPFGQRAVSRMLRRGLPAPFELPLRALFGADPPPHARASAERIEDVRMTLAGRTGTFALPSTSLARPRTLSWTWLANNVSVQRRWGLFLHLCAEAFGAKNILELGACIGISGAYLATASRSPHLVTIEASPELAAAAEETLRGITPHATVLQGMFQDRLADAMTRPVDLAYIDGHHDGDATLAYVRAVMPHLTNGALIVLDDVRLYSEMFAAWQTLSTMRGFSAAVDVGRFGLLVRGDAESVRDYDLSRYTGWWPVGGSRAALAATTAASRAR